MSTTTTKRKDKFLLWLRPDGRYQKRVNGQLHYFYGTADEALAEWLRVKPEAEQLHPPKPDEDAVTVLYVGNHFLSRNGG